CFAASTSFGDCSVGVRALLRSRIMLLPAVYPSCLNSSLNASKRSEPSSNSSPVASKPTRGICDCCWAWASQVEQYSSNAAIIVHVSRFMSDPIFRGCSVWDAVEIWSLYADHVMRFVFCHAPQKFGVQVIHVPLAHIPE